MKDRKGFALIELLVVIAIIAVLVSIVIPTVSTGALKARAAANAANLRSVQAELQIQYLAEPESFDTKTIYLAKNENLQLGNTVSVSAPAAKEVVVGHVSVPQDCAMMVRLMDDSSVVATYNGYTVENFAQIAETGKADGIEVSLMDSIFDNIGDIFDEIGDIIDGIFGGGDSGGSSEDEEIKTIEIDPPLYVDEDALLAYIDKAMDAETLGSDCTTCVHQGTVCPGYRSENGSYACVNCGHYQGVHSTPVLHSVADLAVAVAVEELVCDDMQSAHIWDSNHVCTRCEHEHLLKEHFWMDYTCAICGQVNQDVACADGMHQSFDQDTGKCTNCGEPPKETGMPCGCTDGNVGMGGSYCSKCGHPDNEHEISLDELLTGNLYGACTHNH